MLRLVVLALCVIGCNSSTTNPQPDAPAAACGNLAGTWTIAGTCGADVCVVTQAACSTQLGCSAGAASYAGSITGSSFAYSGTTAQGEPASCNGTLSGNSISGSCVVMGATCSFTGTR